MRRWQNLAAPDDPNSWYDVDGVWPTNRGTYESADSFVGASVSASGGSATRYAFAAKTLSTTIEWIVDSSKIWYYNGTTAADKTNGVTIGTYPHMTQFGNVTVCAMGVSNPTVASTSAGNFAAISGAPNCEIVAVCSNAVGYFNTDDATDGYTISDVGDYTNVTTGESVTGRLIETSGPITAVVSFADSFIVFKASSVYRMRYVGGPVKWAVELLHRSLGCSPTAGGAATQEKYMACASPNGVLFVSGAKSTPASVARNSVWWMDGAGQFQCVTVMNYPFGSTQGRYVGYMAAQDMFFLWGFDADGVAFFYPPTGAWGRVSTPSAVTLSGARPLMGEAPQGAGGSYFSAMPIHYEKPSSATFNRYAPSLSTVPVDSYLQTSMAGKVNRKTKFTRVIPLLRRRVDYGTDSAALSATFYRELHDTSAARTEAVTESSQRKRFDLSITDNFARFKVTFTDLDVEVDDFLIEAVDAGRE